MILRLRVTGYKSLRDSEIPLAPLTVLLGPNGAGKSNLLDLVGLLGRLATAETVREAFREHRGRPLEAFHSPRGFGPSQYATLLENEHLSFRVEVDLDLHPAIVAAVNDDLKRREDVVGAQVTYTRVTETLLRYVVEIAMEPRTGELFVADESLVSLRADGRVKQSRKAFFERTPLANGERFVARVERQSHPRYFELRRQRTLLSELSDAVYHPHVVAAARELASSRVYYVEPARARAEVGVQAASEPGTSGELLAPYLYLLQNKHPTTLRGLVRNLRDLVVGFEDLRVDVRDGQLEIVATMAGGGEFPARLLSEGTLRLLCVLGIAVSPAPPATVVYEEPENGVNPARLERIAEIVRNAVETRRHGSQFVLTTHSAHLCELLPEHLVIARWDEAGGSRFERLPWDPESLFFREEVVRALDSPAPPRPLSRSPPSPARTAAASTPPASAPP